jgi:DNA polymerase III alpha subunit
LDSVSDEYTRPQLFFRWLNMEKEDGLGFLPPAPPLIGDYPSRVRLADEVKTLGIVVSRHPLELFRQRIDRIVRRQHLSPFIGSPAIPEFRGRKVWTAGILVTGKEVATKKREPMIFVSFEDELAIFETVLFPDAFQHFYPLLDDGWAFLIYGRVEDDLGALAISVEKLIPVSRRTEEPGESEAAGADARVAPERPPVFMWGREHAAVPRGLDGAAVHNALSAATSS